MAGRNKDIFFLLIMLLTGNAWAVDKSCASLFLKSGVKAGTKNCEIECGTIPFDMGDFDCSAQCESFCKTYVKPEDVNKLASYVEVRALTLSEKSLAAKFPADALLVYMSKRTAMDSTKRIFSNNLRNDESDAYRHFVWSGLIRSKMDREKASAFLDAHESEEDPKNPERIMDSFNNNKGMDEAEKLMKEKTFSQQNLEKDALDSLKNGELKVLSPSGKVPEWKE